MTHTLQHHSCTSRSCQQVQHRDACPAQHSGRPHLDTGSRLGLPSTGQTDKLGQTQVEEGWKTTCKYRPHQAVLRIPHLPTGQGRARLCPEVLPKRTSISTGLQHSVSHIHNKEGQTLQQRLREAVKLPSRSGGVTIPGGV